MCFTNLKLDGSLSSADVQAEPVRIRDAMATLKNSQLYIFEYRCISTLLSKRQYTTHTDYCRVFELSLTTVNTCLYMDALFKDVMNKHIVQNVNNF